MRPIMTGWTAQHSIQWDRFPSPAGPDPGTEKDPAVPTGLYYPGCLCLVEEPQVPRSLLNQQRMTERPNHQGLELTHYAV